MGILSVCKEMGYRKLVLGVWGCGAFCDNPELMAKLFDKVIHQFECVFDEIEIAILGSPENFDCFHMVIILEKNDD